jgi:bifunctional DNA-binding transcriptional regulator/antitoxin component of YhaV-PrlF toxin-antitoxin module
MPDSQGVKMPKKLTIQLSQRGVVTLPKSLRDAYHLKSGDTLTLIDLGGVFVLSPKLLQVDALADKIAAEWTKSGETLESMLRALRQMREEPSE